MLDRVDEFPAREVMDAARHANAALALARRSRSRTDVASSVCAMKTRGETRGVVRSQAGPGLMQSGRAKGCMQSGRAQAVCSQAGPGLMQSGWPRPGGRDVVEHVSGMSGSCQTLVRLLSGSCQALVRPLGGLGSTCQLISHCDVQEPMTNALS